MLWRPIAGSGPILDETAVRALTILELSDLPELIRQGKRVLLMLGPCASCSRRKGLLLQTILSQDKQLVSHLVVDSGTAFDFLRAINALKE
jgi:hypothetical protein